eukprot:9483056-Pyramimonas_sp.AAC.1
MDDLKQLPELSHDELIDMTSGPKTNHSPLLVQQRSRQPASELVERVNIKLLQAYAQRGEDKNQQFLKKRIDRFLIEGRPVEPAWQG